MGKLRRGLGDLRDNGLSSLKRNTSMLHRGVFEKSCSVTHFVSRLRCHAEKTDYLGNYWRDLAENWYGISEDLKEETTSLIFLEFTALCILRDLFNRPFTTYRNGRVV